MTSLVPVDMLKPHPKNEDYFDDPTPEEYEQIRRSIAEHGIRDPLKVLPDYTVVAGCLRLRIARELGLARVPVEVWDVSPEEAEYLLVADNEERRRCDNPIKKARRAEFLRRYWGVREGSANPKGTVIPREGNFYPHERKTLDEVAQAVGESRENLKKLLKLNDLIRPLQDLVSRGELPQTAAYSLAFLPSEEQEVVLRVLGSSGVCGLSVREAQEIRRQLDAERDRTREAERQLAEIERELAAAGARSGEVEKLLAELARARAENEELKARHPAVVEKVVERVAAGRDPSVDRELSEWRARRDELTAELERLSTRLRERETLEAELEKKRAELAWLERTLGRRLSCAALFRMAERLFGPLEKEREAFFEQLRECEVDGMARLELLRIAGLLRLYADQIETALRTVMVEAVADLAPEGGERSGKGSGVA